MFLCFIQVNPSDIIILEGILVLHDSRVRDLMNMKIFVDTGSLPLSYSNILQMVIVKEAISVLRMMTHDAFRWE